MDQNLTIKVSLKQVEEIVLDYCKKKFKDETLKIETKIKTTEETYGYNEVKMKVYSKNKIIDFDVEREISISNEDIINIFSLRFQDMGFEIIECEWICFNNQKENTKLLFVVYDLEYKPEKRKQKSLGGN